MKKIGTEWEKCNGKFNENFFHLKSQKVNPLDYKTN